MVCMMPDIGSGNLDPRTTFGLLSLFACPVVALQVAAGRQAGRQAGREAGRQAGGIYSHQEYQGIV